MEAILNQLHATPLRIHVNSLSQRFSILKSGPTFSHFEADEAKTLQLSSRIS